MSKTLTQHSDIREWAEARAGLPVITETPNGAGDYHRVLQLSFGQDMLNAEENQGPDRPGGAELVSWDEWLGALDDLQLALKVSDDPSGGAEAEYEIVGR